MSDIIWILKPKNENQDYLDLVVKISNNQDINLSDYDIERVHSVVQTFKNEIIKYLLEHGFSSLMASELLVEQIVAKGTPENKIISIIHKYLDNVKVDNELIIVDPFFLAKSKKINYVNVIDQILDKYIHTITNLIIITNTHSVDTAVKASLISTLKAKKQSLNIAHKQHNDYHDRYWISGSREKGLVMGTSLNGLGNKVALIDRLNTSDVRNIVKELTSDGLL